MNPRKIGQRTYQFLVRHFFSLAPALVILVRHFLSQVGQHTIVSSDSIGILLFFWPDTLVLVTPAPLFL